MGKIGLRNIGTVVTGDLKNSIVEADAILVEDGIIKQVGKEAEIDFNSVDTMIDVQSMTVTPGLIDAHTHPVIGDWTPRLNTLGWMEGALQGGITALISQGSFHVEGLPRTAEAAKTLALLNAQISPNFRPGGAQRVYLGAVVPQPGMTEADFAEMAGKGVTHLAEIGAGGGLYQPEDVRSVVGWAKQYNMVVPVHFGGEAVPGSHRMWSDEVLQIDPDVVVHLNGGPTAAPWTETERVLKESQCYVEIAFNGNPKSAYEIANYLYEHGQMNRLILGSDSPTAFGLSPVVILRTVMQISCLNNIPAAQVLAAATGNTGRAYRLGLGRIVEGAPADLLVMDAPKDSIAVNALQALETGDLPTIALIMVEGKIVSAGARNTLPPVRRVNIVANKN